MEPIPLLVPELPDFSALEPWLKRIDHARHYTNFGPLNAELCSRLATNVDALLPGISPSPQAVTFANCTIALSTWLQEAIGRSGRLVLIPGITFVATAQAVLASGNIPFIADIDAESWLLTPEIAHATLRSHASPGTPSIAAVLPVAAYGAPCDPISWDAFSQDTGLPVLIDAAGAFGNQALGRHCDIALSLHATKSLGAGEGGLILTRNARRAESLIQASNFGLDLATGLVVRAGGNGKLSEYHAAVALAALKRWPEQARRRIALMRQCVDALTTADLPIRLPKQANDGVHTLLPVLLPEDARAQTVQQTLAESGIQTRRWYCPPLHHHPLFAKLPRSRSLPVCDLLGERLLGLPFHLSLREAELERITHALSAALG